MASWAGSSGPRAAAGGAAAELRLVSLTVRRSRAGGGLRVPPAAGAGVPLARLRCSLRAWALIPEKQPCGVSRARPPVPGSGHRSHSLLHLAGLGEPQDSATDRILEGWAPWGLPQEPDSAAVLNPKHPTGARQHPAVGPCGMPSPTRPLAHLSPACACWLDENRSSPHISQEEAADSPGPPSLPLGTQLFLPGPPPTRQVRGVVCPLAHTQSHPRKALDRPVRVGSALSHESHTEAGKPPGALVSRHCASPAGQGVRSEPSESPHSRCLQRPAHDHSRQKRTPPGEGWGQAGARALPHRELAATRKGDRLLPAGEGSRRLCNPQGAGAAGGRPLAQPSRSASRLPGPLPQSRAGGGAGWG